MPTPTLNKIKSVDVENTYKLFPKTAQEKLLHIRQMIFDLAKNNDDVSEIEETLKWGEPAYVTKSGSTIRLAWKSQAPENYAVYFICSTKLVETFREIYPQTFSYEDNRAIIFSFDDEIPQNELEHCLLLALTYQKIKNLPLLGV